MGLQIIFILQFLAFTISCAFANRWRGGWEVSWLKINNHQIKRITVAVLGTAALLTPLASMIHWCIWLSCFLSLLILGLVMGWGSWFFVGRSEDSWKHNPDAFYVEYITYWIFGAKWIPANHGLSPEELAKLTSRFNLKLSPNMSIRPMDWRIKMEKTAMAIRGLGITVPVSLILFFYFKMHYDINHYQFFIIAPIGYLMGFCYDIGFHLNLKKFPSWLSITTNVGEFLTGGLIFGAGLFLASSICANSLQGILQ